MCAALQPKQNRHSNARLQTTTLLEETARALGESVWLGLVPAAHWNSVGLFACKMSQLRKLIVLTPEQLLRLRGRNLDVTDQYDANRLQVLESVAKKVKQIGPSQAYAQYQEAQQRHLHHAAKDRAEPLQMTVADPPALPQSVADQMKTLEETGEKNQLEEKRRAKREAALRKAARAAASIQRKREEAKILREAKRAAKNSKKNVSVSPIVSPVKTRSKTNKLGNSSWLSLR